MAYSRRGNVRGIDVHDVNTIVAGTFFVNSAPHPDWSKSGKIPHAGDCLSRQNIFAGYRPGSGAHGKNKVVGSQQCLAVPPGLHFRQRIASGNEVEGALIPSEATLKLLHRIDGKRAGLRLQFDHRRNKGRDAGDRQAHHGVSVHKRNQILTEFVRGLGGNNKVHLRQ